MDELCPLCEGSGLRLFERPDGSRVARDCDCRIKGRQTKALVRANIPRRYENASFEDFRTDIDDVDHSISIARFTARKFVASYPLGTHGNGLLITGRVGAGKTHLAVAALKGLIARGASGIFCHYHDLLKQVQNSFNRQVQSTELEILAPIFNVEVLVLDELGASKPSDWVSDTVSHILNTRYNERRITIVTTNYPNAAPILNSGVALSAFAEAREAMREETLGDRIGERMRSRLQEMCVVIEMHGVDYRQSEKLARIG